MTMNTIEIEPQLYTTKPKDTRLPKEMAVYDLLDTLKMPYVRLDHVATAQVEYCEEVGGILGVGVCKNLFLCNRKKTEFYLLMLPGKKEFHTQEISAQIGSTHLSFASPEFMEQFLNITPGSVSVMGLMNDTEKKVQLLIDRDIAKLDYFGCHPCINTTSLKIKTTDLFEKFLPFVGHEPIIVTL